ncbi:MAG: flagellar motor protein MotB [Nocardioides sp.]|nr:flagellar motor protein MotB [Nocardioides sp.]
MAGRGRRRGGHDEEHENHERWLVTYADMVTLLMVLFIVMFSMSQVDERKYQELKEGLAAGFGVNDSVLSGARSVNTEVGSQQVEAIAPILADGDMTPQQKEEVARAVAQAEFLTRDRAKADAVAEVRRLEQVRKAMVRALRKKGLQRDIATTYDERGLVISLVSRHVVFRNDLATLTTRGEKVVDALAPVLRDLREDLSVDGHTNQVPVKPRYYATDWDLSSARAVTVLRRLEERWTIPAHRLSTASFGHTKPLVDPSKPHSQEVNKRVDIVVLSPLAPEVAALIPENAGDRAGSGSSEEASTTDDAGHATDDTDHSTSDQPDQTDHAAALPVGPTPVTGGTS